MGEATANPLGVCDLSSESACDNCELDGKLHCRYDEKLRNLFLAVHIPFRILLFLGLAYVGLITGIWWFLVAYAVGFALNFGLIETRYLCRHCPFYAQEGSVLRCITLYGMPKPWKYDPGPLTKSDRVLQIIFGGFVDVFPLLAYSYVIWYIIAHNLDFLAVMGFVVIFLITIVFFVQSGLIITRGYCTACANLSCPMNKVPKALADEYLRKNRIMREAWEKRGYKPEGSR